MPKKYRLTGEEIRNLRGSRVHGTFFSLLVAPIAGDHPKCASVVSKKVSLRAVDRNVIKRRCRAALAKHISIVQKPLALVFYAKRETLRAPFSDIEADIAALLLRAAKSGARP